MKSEKMSGKNQGRREDEKQQTTQGEKKRVDQTRYRLQERRAM